MQLTDQAGKIIRLDHLPTKIISVVPSQTELLSWFGLDQEVIGITKFCVHPAHWHKEKTKIGGTKKLDIDRIRALQPDLVIANKEENLRAEIEAIEKFCPCYVSDVRDRASAYEMIHDLGQLLGKASGALSIVNEISEQFEKLNVRKKYRAAYLVWNDPLMTVGGDSFINDMMQSAGFENVFANESRYPQVTKEIILSKNIELLLLSTEPFPFSQKHIEFFKKEFPTTRILLVDGEIFSWYGNRMLLAPSYFNGLQEQLLAQVPESSR
jgi:ABC-type Fe3+-hydroxamate transport system substrate-binding protein